MLMTLGEYAKSREISRRFLYKLVVQGKVPAGKNGRRWLLIPDKVDAAMESLFGKVNVKMDKMDVPKIKNGSFKAALAAMVG